MINSVHGVLGVDYILLFDLLLRLLFNLVFTLCPLLLWLLVNKFSAVGSQVWGFTDLGHLLEQVNCLGVNLLLLHADAGHVELHVPKDVLTCVFKDFANLGRRECLLFKHHFETTRQVSVTVTSMVVKVALPLAEQVKDFPKQL